MELWGGVECTVNRVADEWRNQLTFSGHARRLDDLRRIRDLGIRTVRYPVLWESAAPCFQQIPDLLWAEQRLLGLRELGITPIVGLLHHGSGPAFTNLLDSNFAAHFAAYALQVAERFPWVQHFTPINEPLTTARFSALYGHWYPHRRDTRSFVRALINQCRAISLAMRSIRLFSPRAALVQTEDIGTAYSTPHMQYQRDFENNRRWLTWDLLCGRVDSAHPLYSFLTEHGIGVAELAWFCDLPCPPQIIGVNHYVTSDRYLDERTGRYAPEACGRNDRETYADLEAVRLPHRDYRGWQVIRQAWDRYRIPVAVTEVHIGCTREEQLRWFAQAWQAAITAREAGCDIKAVTAWSLFGSHDWNSLLTRTTGYYEPGAFDVRSPEPRATALAHLLRHLSFGGEPRHPVVTGRGWWEQQAPSPPRRLTIGSPAPEPVSAPLILCGRATALTETMIQASRARNLAVHVLGTTETVEEAESEIEQLLGRVKPWAIIHVCEEMNDDEVAPRERRGDSSTWQALLLGGARRHKIPYLMFSSDAVFDGAAMVPYVESTPASPLDAEGRKLLDLETLALAYEYTLCVRTSHLFGTATDGSLVSHASTAVAEYSGANSPVEQLISPTYLPDLVHATLDLLIDGFTGLVHLVNQGALSREAFAQRRFLLMKPSGGAISSRVEKNEQHVRQSYRVMKSERVYIMPSLEDALSRFATDSARSVQPGPQAVAS